MIDLRNHIEILDLDIDSVLCRSIKFRDLLLEDQFRKAFILESLIESCFVGLPPAVWTFARFKFCFEFCKTAAKFTLGALGDIVRTLGTNL